MDNMTFEFRELKSSDMFPMFRILGKIGFKDLKGRMTPESIKNLMDAFTDQGGQEEDMSSYVGMSVVMEIAEVIISNLPSCEQDIFEFLGSVTGMKAEEVADLPLSTFAEMIIEFVQKEEFRDFFKVVSKLFN